MDKTLKLSTLLFFYFALLSNIAIAQQKQAFPFKDTSLSIEERVNDLVARMTLKEKAQQLFYQAPAIDRLEVPAYNWWNECLHGVARAGKATVFPQAIGLAATFDKDLMLRIGSAVSDEARAKNSDFIRNNVRSIYTGLTFWTPNINIFRDPRWGRGQETYGEDPFLTGRMAVNYINGLQGNDPQYLKVVATAKHYAVHSGPEYSRHIDNIYVNDRDLYETYLPAFKDVVQEANVRSVMCAYNRFRDKPCCGSDILLTNILRNQLGFNGYVVSDCGAISDFYTKNTHHVVESPSQAFGWSLSAGTDLNCEEQKAFFEDNFDEAVRKGMINENDINVSLKRLLKERFMLGMFDPDNQVAYTRIPISVVGSPEHLQLTEEAAEKSLVLLKNSGILPLQKNKKIALIGPNANELNVLLGNYNGDPISPSTPLKALQDKLGSKNVIYTPGCPIASNKYTDFQIVSERNLFHLENGKLKKGLKAEYFNGQNASAKAEFTRIDKKIDFYWTKSPINQSVDSAFGVRWSGVIVPERSGNYIFSTNLKLKIDGKPVSESEIRLEKGIRYKLDAVLEIKYSAYINNIQRQFANLSWFDASRDIKKEAIDAAKNSDVIVFCGGISSNLEGEEMKLEVEGFSHGDRTNIQLPKVQEDLLKELVKCGKPIVYINFSGSAIALNWENENLDAVVQAFYPGEATGKALTNLLFGDFNPSGRLPVTFYKSVDQLPDFKNYEMEGRTYRFFKGEPLYPFGYGLSYTQFTYSNLQFSKNKINTTDSVEVSVDVTNSGKLKGDEIVQLYIKHKISDPSSPGIELKGFERITLEPSEMKKVKFTIDKSKLAYLGYDMKYTVAPGEFDILVGKSSADLIKKTLIVE